MSQNTPIERKSLSTRLLPRGWELAFHQLSLRPPDGPFLVLLPPRGHTQYISVEMALKDRPKQLVSLDVPRCLSYLGLRPKFRMDKQLYHQKNRHSGQIVPTAQINSFCETLIVSIRFHAAEQSSRSHSSFAFTASRGAGRARPMCRTKDHASYPELTCQMSLMQIEMSFFQVIFHFGKKFSTTKVN